MAALAEPGVQYLPMTGSMSIIGSHHRQNCGQSIVSIVRANRFVKTPCRDTARLVRMRDIRRCGVSYRAFHAPLEMRDTGGAGQSWRRSAVSRISYTP